MATMLIILIVAISLLVLFLLNFYRDPERKISKGDNIVSPADGRIIKILKTGSSKIMSYKGIGKIKTVASGIAKECYVINIFMSPFDVHINRAPIEGRVLSVKHSKGKFFAAYSPKALLNEKNEIMLKNKKIKLKVIQIAGFLARRIICNLKKNEKVNKGQRIGKIVLGSQVMLILPSKKINLKIKTKQKVKAGTTIIAAY